MTLRIVISGKPQPKQRPRRGKGGQWYTPKETRLYEERVAYNALVAARNQGWRKTSEQVVMAVRIFKANGRRMDADNVVKAIADGLNRCGQIWEDDCQCLPQVVSVEVDRERPRVEVRLEAKR